MSDAVKRLTAEELAAAKAYMRIDTDDEDGVVTTCVLAAQAYLEGAGVPKPDADHPKRSIYDIVCHALALSVYDGRDPVIKGAVVADNPVLRQMLTQLKLTTPWEG